MKNYMFDTNVFNAILKEEIDVSGLRGKGKCFATHVQLDEIKRTGNQQLRKDLINTFVSVMDQSVPTSSFVLNKSKLGMACLGDGQTFKSIKSKLDKLNKSKPNNIEDALIAETAIKNNFTLVTHDRDLFKIVTKDFSGKAANIYQILDVEGKESDAVQSQPKKD